MPEIMPLKKRHLLKGSVWFDAYLIKYGKDIIMLNSKGENRKVERAALAKESGKHEKRKLLSTTVRSIEG